ncbi:hypothetical protein AXF42_Ash002666 [Apostasia shenzhenica]|uniref:NAB domain-containing protein n=1 Tax=Apostasia shenzhenica TaxID=1088818 RepID=A0A2I0A6Y2_9ASPA|nr:hypothetical protein AXF42_Ash002666 [Apostasia shenzhenica]
MNSSFSFLSSFQSNLLAGGLANQVGWGHAWNRFAGPLSCRHQRHQCAFTPLLPSGWWDGDWQSPIPRDIRRLRAFGVQLNQTGHVIDGSLESYCARRKDHDPGDSLAQRAEFYYQKKPELLKIVEEVERLCRSLTLHCSQQSRRSSPPSTSQIAGGKTTKIESLRSSAEHSTAEDPDSELLAESKFEDSTISCEPTMQLLTSASCEHLKELARRNEEKRLAIAELWSQMEVLMKQNVELMAENEALAARLQDEKQNHLPAACSRCSRINGRKHAISDQLARLKTLLVSAFWGEHSS